MALRRSPGFLRPAGGEGNRALVQTLGQSLLARILILPINALVGLAIARIIIGRFGAGQYAQYGLLVGLSAMIPFADFGVSAAVMNAIGESGAPSDDEHVVRTLVSAVRLLCVSAVAIITLGILVTLIGGWRLLLGSGLHEGRAAELAAGACVAMLALALPFSFGQRVLVGIRKNHLAIVLMGLQWPIALAGIAALALASQRVGPFAATLPYAATVAVSLLCAVVAAKQLRPAVGHALRLLPMRHQRGARVLDVAWPMLVQMIALPIAMQSDRIVLSQVSSTSSLAQYNLASQMFSPIWALIGAAGISLWPIFARARADSDRTTSLAQRLALAFAGVVAVICAVLCALGGTVSEVASGSKIALPLSLLVTFAAFSVLQAAKFPLGMYMTDAAGLRFQALMIVIFLPINLGLSIVLAKQIGAAGPMVGSIVGVFFCQVLANWIYLARARQRAPMELRPESAEAV